MTIGERIEKRRKALGIASQSELARMAGMKQTTLNGLIRKPYRWSPHLIPIARALQTSVEYLVGEVDDPDGETVMLPSPVERAQSLLMRVDFPSEAALTAMFQAQLQAFARLQGDDLARALAKRLPKALARLQDVTTYEVTEPLGEEPEDVELPATDHPARRQARHK